MALEGYRHPINWEGLKKYGGGPKTDYGNGLVDLGEFSFKQAFARARKEIGGGKTFLWRGKAYNTNIAGEATGAAKTNDTTANLASTDSFRLPMYKGTSAVNSGTEILTSQEEADRNLQGVNNFLLDIYRQFQNNIARPRSPEAFPEVPEGTGFLKQQGYY